MTRTINRKKQNTEASINLCTSLDYMLRTKGSTFEIAVENDLERSLLRSRLTLISTHRPPTLEPKCYFNGVLLERLSRLKIKPACDSPPIRGLVSRNGDKKSLLENVFFKLMLLTWRHFGEMETWKFTNSIIINNVVGDTTIACWPTDCVN